MKKVTRLLSLPSSQSYIFSSQLIKKVGLQFHDNYDFLNHSTSRCVLIWYIFYVIVFSLKHVDEENCYLCGYLKITGLTFEFPTLTTFFDAEIISKRYPFLTRKWDADEEVDRKHWVSVNCAELSPLIIIEIF